MSVGADHTRSVVDYWNQTMITIDTGANLDAILQYLPGMIVYCTADGGTNFSFKAKHAYQRKEDNSGWREFVISGLGQILTNKTLDSASNTISAIPTASILNNAVTVAKLSGLPYTVLATYTDATSFSTSSGSYVDVTSVTLTITALGNRALLITEFTSNWQNTAQGNGMYMRITDGTTTFAETYAQCMTLNQPQMGCCSAYESAPSAGSLTRKLQVQAQAGTVTINNNTLTKGKSFYMMEVI